MAIEGGWKLVCMILSLVMFALASFWGFWVPATSPPSPYFDRLVAGGLFFFVLAQMVR